MSSTEETILKEKTFRGIVELALDKLKLHKPQVKSLHVEVVWNLTTHNDTGNFIVVFRDQQVLSWLQTDPATSESVKTWDSKVQELSAEFTIHFKEHILNLDRKGYTISVETKLPYKSRVTNTVVACSGSHYNGINLTDEDKWNKLRDRDKLILRIAWGIWQAYKYWNEEVNKMKKDVSQ